MLELLFNTEVLSSTSTALLVFLGAVVYISTASGALVYWIFAVKYWSIAIKIELAIEDQDIKKKNQVIGLVMFGGIFLISVLAIFVALDFVSLY